MEGAFGRWKGNTADSYKTSEFELRLTGLLISDPSLTQRTETIPCMKWRL